MIFYVRDPFNAPASYVPSPKSIDDFLNTVSAGKWIDGVQSFVKGVEKCEWGLDVAVLQDGGLKLIEVNRSPQFKRFTELTVIDLVKKLEQGVL